MPTNLRKLCSGIMQETPDRNDALIAEIRRQASNPSNRRFNRSLWYSGFPGDMPDEMIELLAQLDRVTPRTAKS